MYTKVKEKNKESKKKENERLGIIITPKYTMGCDGSALDQIMYQIQGSALF